MPKQFPLKSLSLRESDGKQLLHVNRATNATKLFPTSRFIFNLLLEAGITAYNERVLGGWKLLIDREGRFPSWPVASMEREPLRCF